MKMFEKLWRAIQNIVEIIANNHRIGWLALAIVAFVPFLGIGFGHDFIMHYWRRTLTGVYGESTWLPYYGYWLITPFTLFSPKVGLALWNLVNAVGLGLLCRRWKTNPLFIALLFPVWYSFGNGQMAGIIAGGVWLALASNPLLAGLGLVILSIKPQIGMLIALFVLLRRFHWKLLVVPAVVFGLSLIQWGWWLPEWLNSVVVNSNGLRGTAWNATAFPWGLAILPVLWFYRNNPKLWLAATPLVAPYFAIYSLALPVTVGMTWWLWALTWVVSLIYVVGGYTPLWALVSLGLVWVAARSGYSGEEKTAHGVSASP